MTTAPARPAAGRARHAALGLLAGALLLAVPALAEWLQPDPSYRDAQFQLRAAIRDTLGQGGNATRLDTLGVALLRLGRFEDAAKIFHRTLELNPGDDAAEGGLGKLALFSGRLAEAESLLAAAGDEPESRADLYAALLRRGGYARAAEMAEAMGQGGRGELLRLMAERSAYAVEAGPEEGAVGWDRAYPVALVRVRLNGHSVLMALDLGVTDLILDKSAANVCKVQRLASQSSVMWSGARVAVTNAMAQRLEIAGYRVANLPAGVLSLRRWSLEVNPHGETVAGVIGVNFLRRFGATLDWKAQRLELRRPGRAYTPRAGAQRVPFELWGESEMMVYGALAGGRRMALMLQTGVAGCGVGAPREVFDEVGVKPGLTSRLVKGAGQFLQGRPWVAVVVPTVSVGPIVDDKVPGWSGALDSSELWRHGVRRDALLSNDFFTGRRVTIDWEGQMLSFEGGE